MANRLKFVPALIVYLIVVLLPGVIFVQDASLLFIFPYYLALMLPPVVFTAWSVSRRKLPLKSLHQKTIVILTILIPFFVLTAYPFHLVNILFAIGVFVFGFGLPFWSVYLTWWFYTLGGSMPLPKDHNWMIGQKNYKGSGKEYKAFVDQSLGIVGPLGIAAFFIANNIGSLGPLLLIQAIAILLLFGFSLTLGADLKKRSLKK